MMVEEKSWDQQNQCSSSMNVCTNVTTIHQVAVLTKLVG